MKIHNRSGELIVETHDDQGKFLSELKLPNANFRDMDLKGAFFDDRGLTGANFAGADLYSAYLYSAARRTRFFTANSRVICDFVTYDGEDLATIETNFHGAVDEYLAFCEAEGKTPNVPF